LGTFPWVPNLGKGKEGRGFYLRPGLRKEFVGFNSLNINLGGGIKFTKKA